MSRVCSIRSLGALAVLGAMLLTLPGCGGGEAAVGPSGTVEAVPPTNPAPDATKDESQFP